ncbi:MAG TPA: VOC family protein [Anaerolineae bacterium]|jgi:PhnB protein
MSTSTIQLVPHLHFEGDCETALDTYKTIFNGSYEIVQWQGNPADPEKRKVMYAVFKFDGNVLYMGDVMGRTLNKDIGTTALALNMPDATTAKHIFDQLAEGGKVIVPYAKQFWGAWHGNLFDRFGVRWLINCQTE